MRNNNIRIWASEAIPPGGSAAPFWNWRAAAGQEPAHLRIDGVIDTGTSWFEDTVTPRQFKAELDAHEGEMIVIDINSPGGDVFAAFDILDMLKNRRGVTRVRIPALCASAASIIAMGASRGELVMTRTGMMMIHNPIVGACGNAQALREHAHVLDELTDIMVGIYMDRFTGEESALRRLLDDETYMSPQEAVSHGLADRIEDTEPVSASCTARYAAGIGEALAHVPGALREKRARASAQKGLSAERRRALLECEQQYHNTMMME